MYLLLKGQSIFLALLYHQEWADLSQQLPKSGMQISEDPPARSKGQTSTLSFLATNRVKGEYYLCLGPSSKRRQTEPPW